MRSLIVCSLLFCLCLVSAAQPEIGAPATGEIKQPPIIKRINLNNLPALQALQILKVEGAFAPFVPKEIIDIVGLQGLNALLVRAKNEAAIEQLEQILRALDQRDNNSNATNLLTAYVIELKSIMPEPMVQMLLGEGEGSSLKVFVPKGITEIIAIPNSNKLLFQATDAGAALQLSRLISLIDRPHRLALQGMLIVLAPPGPEGERQPMPNADGNMLLTVEAVRTWTQSLIDTRSGSVIAFPDQPTGIEKNRLGMMAVHPVTLQMPPFVTDIESIFISYLRPEQLDAWMPETGQRFKTNVIATWRMRPDEMVEMKAKPLEVTLVIGQTTLIPVQTKEPAFPDPIPPPGKRYFLAVTPVFILPSIPELGFTTGPFGIEGADFHGLPGGLVTN